MLPVFTNAATLACNVRRRGRQRPPEVRAAVQEVIDRETQAGLQRFRDDMAPYLTN